MIGTLQRETVRLHADWKEFLTKHTKTWYSIAPGVYFVDGSLAQPKLVGGP